jgi:hypothetical protein
MGYQRRPALVCPETANPGRSAHLDPRQCASGLVTLQDAARRCAMAGGHPGPSLRTLAGRVQVGTRG